MAEALSADERVSRFLIEELRNRRVTIWRGEGEPDNPPLADDRMFEPQVTHLRNCPTTYAADVRPVEVGTGYCPTCAETFFGTMFTAACTCGYRHGDLLWVAEKPGGYDFDDLYRRLDEISSRLRRKEVSSWPPTATAS